MRLYASDGAHEFVVAPELAEVTERLGVPLHAGDRVRFEVIDGECEAAPRRRWLGWIGSVSTGEHTLSERVKDDVREVAPELDRRWAVFLVQPRAKVSLAGVSYLTRAAAYGHAMINRELYLPRSWTTEPDRCERVGVPSDAECLTKPALPAGMPSRALRASVAAQWVAADEVYSADSALRTEMEAQ